MAKTPEESLAGMISALKEKTGKTLDEWHELIDKTSLAKHGEILGFLKTEHGISHGYANQIALHIRDRRTPTASDDPIEQLFSGPKAALKPVYDAVAAQIMKLGADVEFAPKRTYISVRRKKQFAILQASTATRLDVGINLKGREPAGRLEASGSFNAMVTHRVKLSSVDEVDAELSQWLGEAYAEA